MHVAAILRHKGTDVAHVAATETIAGVAALLHARRIGAVLVKDQADQLVGIVSERDIIRSLALHGAQVLEMTAGQLMTRDVTTATLQTSAIEALEVMTVGRFRHLPVMEGGRVAGIVSIGDVVKARLTQQEQEVDSLKAYVAGA
jgi:CBS domain-containing protein